MNTKIFMRLSFGLQSELFHRFLRFSHAKNAHRMKPALRHAGSGRSPFRPDTIGRYRSSLLSAGTGLLLVFLLIAVFFSLLAGGSRVPRQTPKFAPVVQISIPSNPSTCKSPPPVDKSFFHPVFKFPPLVEISPFPPSRSSCSSWFKSLTSSPPSLPSVQPSSFSPAQALSPGADALGVWVLCALLVSAGIAAVIKSFRRHPPIESEFATKAELAAMSAGLSTRLSTLDTRIENMQRDQARMLHEWDRADETRSSKIHNRVDQILSAVSELSGMVKSLPCMKGNPCEH